MGRYLIFVTVCLCLAQLSSQNPTDLFDPLDSIFASLDKTDPSYEGPVSEWSGQGQRFGVNVPKVKIPTLESAPSNLTFISDYVLKSQPVVIKGLLKQMTQQTRFGGIELTSDDLLKSGRAAISLAEAQWAKKPGSKVISIRDLVKENKNGEELYVRTPIPYAFKSQLQVPQALRCKPLLDDMLTDTKQVLFDFFYALPLKQEYVNQLYCMVEGDKEAVLIHPDDFETWEKLDLKVDKRGGRLAPFVGMRKVDFAKDKLLKDVKKVRVAKIRDGDCLFVPSDWISQMTSMGKDNSLELRWKNDLQNYESCTEVKRSVSPTATLGDFRFPNEGITERPPEKSTDRKRKEISTLAHFVERTLIAPGSRNWEDFVSIAKMDPVLTPQLPKWDEECEANAKVLFALLDRNGDERLDETDLAGIDDEKVIAMAGRVLDRVQDFAELIFDMRIDVAVAKSGIPPEGPRGIDILDLIQHTEEDEVKQEKKWRKAEKEKKQKEEDEEENSKSKSKENLRDEL